MMERRFIFMEQRMRLMHQNFRITDKFVIEEIRTLKDRSQEVVLRKLRRDEE